MMGVAPAYLLLLGVVAVSGDCIAGHAFPTLLEECGAFRKRTVCEAPQRHWFLVRGSHVSAWG